MMEYRNCDKCGRGLNCETSCARAGRCYECIWAEIRAARDAVEQAEMKQYKNTTYWRGKLQAAKSRLERAVTVKVVMERY